MTLSTFAGENTSTQQEVAEGYDYDTLVIAIIMIVSCAIAGLFVGLAAYS